MVPGEGVAFVRSGDRWVACQAETVKASSLQELLHGNSLVRVEGSEVALHLLNAMPPSKRRRLNQEKCSFIRRVMAARFLSP